MPDPTLSPASPYGAAHARLLESQAPPSVLAGPDGRVLHASPAAHAFFAHPDAPTLCDRVDGALRDVLRVTVAAARRDGAARSEPVEVRTREGGQSVALDVRVDPEGTALVVFDGRSATAAGALAETSADLRAATDRLRTVLHALPVGVWITDARGRVVETNPRADEIWAGEAPLAEDVAGYAVYETWYPETGLPVAPDEQPLARVLATGQRVMDVEMAIRRFDGTEGVIHSSAAPVLGPDGALVGAVGVALDVTERRRAEAALRASEERFRRLAETVPDGVFTTSPDGVVTYVNARHAELTGVEAGDVIGTTLWPDLIHPGDRDAAEGAWAEALARAVPFETRYRICTGPDAFCWVMVRARPVFGPDGALAQWYGTLTDIDALIRAEAAVRDLNATLEERVEERTAQVRELARALTVAEQEERRRIAHVLHDDLQPTLAGALIAVAQADLARLEPILDRALTTARTLSHEICPPLLRDSDLRTLLAWVVDRKRAEHGLSVDLDVADGLAVADESLRVLLYQLLRELLFNVVKHAGAEVARVAVVRDGGVLRLTVEDDGVGFDTSALAGRARTGLGLPSVRERVELVGGTVAVESAPGAGTRITIEVPADAPAD